MATPSGKSKNQQDEYDRLLHRRKGLSSSEFAGVGLQFATTIVVFAFAGIWLDKSLGTSPWLVILLVFGGAGLGFWSMYRKVMKGTGRASARGEGGGGGGGGGETGKGGEP